MHPYLVCSSRLESKLDMSISAVPFYYPVSGACGLGIQIGNRKFLAVVFASAYGLIHNARIFFYIARYKRFILTDKGMTGNLLCKSGMCGIRLGNYKQTRGIFIYAVDYTGTDLSVYRRKPAGAMTQKCVDQCSVGITGGWVNDHSLRFVYYQQIFVFIDYIQRYILRLCFYRFGRRQENLDRVAVAKTIVLVNGKAVHTDAPGTDKPLRRGTAEIAFRGHKDVESYADIALIDRRKYHRYSLSPPAPL